MATIAERAAEQIAEIYHPLLEDPHSSETYVSSKVAATIDCEYADVVRLLETLTDACDGNYSELVKECRAAIAQVRGEA